eukprot:122049-Rhodomonas_salina.1
MSLNFLMIHKAADEMRQCLLKVGPDPAAHGPALELEAPFDAVRVRAVMSEPDVGGPGTTRRASRSRMSSLRGSSPRMTKLRRRGASLLKASASCERPILSSTD